MPSAATRPLLLIIALACAAAVLVGPATASGQEAPPFLVGTGIASTSPEAPVCIGGYGSFCTRPSRGEKDPLQARALAISGRSAPQDGTILVTTTTVGLFAAYKDEFGDTGIVAARRRIAEATGVDPAAVVVVSDHSHAGPDTIGIWGGVDAAYMQRLTDGIVDAAVAAWAAREPAAISWAAVDTEPLGYTLDSSYDAGPTDDAAMDNEFRVLAADAPDGRRIATFANYAPHATVCGSCDDLLSGDWTAWAAQEAEARWGGTGFGAVGALGAADWRKEGDLPTREGEARERLRTLLDAADAALTPVAGDVVAGRSVFIREPIAQPVLMLNLLPGVSDPTGLSGQDGDLRIDRAVTPPYLTGTVTGTYGGVVRIGDVALALFPGEPFPQLHDLLRRGAAGTGGIGASAVFLLGGAQDFLGYMTADDESYQQTLEEGALFLAGCPEESVYAGLGHDHDGACPDHWTLQVSPTIGLHLVCTAQDAADAVGLATGPRDPRCAALTLLDGLGDPVVGPPNP